MAQYSNLILNGSSRAALSREEVLVHLDEQLTKHALPVGDLSLLPEPLLLSCAQRQHNAQNLGLRVLKLLSELSTTPRPVQTVGILDMDAHFQTIELMGYPNAKYRDFMVFEVQAAVPAGLVKRSPHLEAWAAERGGLRHETRVPPTPALNATEFHYLADSLRQQFRLDALVGVTPGGIAVETPNGVQTGLLSDARPGTQALSSHGFRSMVRLSGRPFKEGTRRWLEAHFDVLRAAR